MSLGPQASMASADVKTKLLNRLHHRGHGESRRSSKLLGPCAPLCSLCFKCFAEPSLRIGTSQRHEGACTSWRKASTAGGPDPTPSSCLKYTYTSDQLCSFTRSAHCVSDCVS